MSTLELCHDRSKKCTKCDLVYIMKDYITPLMQWLSNDIESFYIRMNKTKCLNTGVMLMYFMGGSKGIEIMNKCDCENTRRKHKSGLEKNEYVLNKLYRQLKNKNFINRQLYYKMAKYFLICINLI